MRQEACLYRFTLINKNRWDQTLYTKYSSVLHLNYLLYSFLPNHLIKRSTCSKSSCISCFWFSGGTNINSLRERCPNTEFFLVSIFLYSVRIQENIDQKKLRIWTLFTQWLCKHAISEVMLFEMVALLKICLIFSK